MHLARLTIRNFRNFAAVDAELPADGVVVLGANGHGKTNLLEAIYYLVLFRSLRGAKDRELVRFDEAGFFVAADAVGAARTAAAGANGGAHRVAAGYEVARRKKKVTVDGDEVRKLADAVGTVTAVSISPADREIVAGGPAGRRRYLDVLLSLGRRGYLSDLTAMRAALRQRNAALKRGRGPDARAFDEPFAQAGARVAEARREWTACWRDRYGQLCTALGEAGQPSLRYAARHEAEEQDAAALLRALGATLERDLRRGMTTMGPHRDDVRLELEGHELRRYGSAGQQRTAAIALRLLEAETLRGAHGVPPIGLYDDVFAELDANRQARLLDLIQSSLPGQAILTAPRESEVPRALLDRPRWTMIEGRLEA